jgi:hypothetical protein
VAISVGKIEAAGWLLAEGPCLPGRVRLLEAETRISIKAVTSDVEGQEPRTEDIDALEYDAERASA